MIVIEDLYYNYGRKNKKKLNGNVHSELSIRNILIENGERVALVGLNGSGKSTLIKTLIGILKPNQGKLYVNGMIPYSNRVKLVKDIGVIWGNRSTLWSDLTPVENLDILRKIYKSDKKKYNEIVKECVTNLGCDSFMNRQIRRLSLGQRMKIEFIASIAHNPKILIYDEPFLGLDFLSKRDILMHIDKYLNTYNSTLLLTAHDIDDISYLCKKVALLNKGSLVAYETIETLIDFSHETVHKIEIEFDELPNIKDLNFVAELDLSIITTDTNSNKILFQSKNKDYLNIVISEILTLKNEVKNINFLDKSLNSSIEQMLLKRT